jgi:phosphonopyruvate decarboxylase
MMSPEVFYKLLKSNSIDFFAGIPDSLLKSICGYITDHEQSQDHIIAANEGAAIALGAGYHLATKKVALVYMQNSGMGNATNPLLSLTDQNVYSIPMILMIGWRGEPGVNDEPQHFKQGEITTDLLDVMNIPYRIIPDDIEEASEVITEAVEYTKTHKRPLAFIIKKGLFSDYELKNKTITHFEMNREEAMKFVVDTLDEKDVVVSTTGKTSRELFEYRAELKQGHNKDFLTVGSMGHANQIALAIALKKADRTVYCFDGDGALLMHAGSLGIIGDLAPKNFKHIVFNNGAHDSVGGQPTIGFNLNFSKMAQLFNYKNTFEASTIQELKIALENLSDADGPALLEVKVNKGARKELGRPTSTPIENKNNFINFLAE